MKNDNHVWDNKLPTAQMLGRWQPWHAGHQKLFEEILKKTGQVNIMVRDVKGVDDNPFDFETVKKNIFEALKEYKNRIKVTLVPNITNLNQKLPRAPAQNQKTQVAENYRYEVFGESGWRGSIRLVKLVSKNPVSAHNLLPVA